jgi:1-acyl-sn-glycerol-3-phosphate acyltransferase
MSEQNFLDSTKVSKLGSIFPTIYFYSKLLKIVFDASSLAKAGKYDDNEWVKSSVRVLNALKRVGCDVEITGIENFISIPEPVVFIGNHMSTLETFVLPCIIQPHKKVTFVVKKGLIEYPVFKHVMISRDPVVVTRENPREDLKVVLNDGAEKLKNGVSIIVFPQTTRTPKFDPKEFNTIGIKLAKKAGVKVVPVAIRSDAWSNGKFLKDFGKTYPNRPVRFAFGKPVEVTSRGDMQHEYVVSFIKEHLNEWGLKTVEN